MGTRVQKALDDPVFKRMKTNDRKDAVASKQTACGRERALQFVELAVDLNANRLKTARGRMLRRVIFVFRYRTGNQIGQLSRALNGCFFTHAADGTRNFSGETLFAVVAQHAGNV